MKDLKYYQKIIQDKRKQTNFRDFLKDIGSWQPLVFHKNDGIVSRFPESPRIGGIVKVGDFYEKNTDTYAQGLNFSGDIFSDFQSLMKQVYLPHMINFFGSENSEYADVVNKSKNAYLSAITIYDCENVLYSISTKDHSINVLNSVMVNVHNENIYQSVGVIRSYNIYYSRYINNSNNIWFSTNLIGCSECIDCDNLDNASYCISNKKYSKEEYLVKKVELLKDKNNYLSKYSQLPNKGNFVDSSNVGGNFITSSHNVENGYFVNNVNRGRNLFFTGGVDGNEDMYDIVNGGAPSGSNIYGVNGVGNGTEHAYISMNVPKCNNVYYSFFLESCSYCIGCIGLKNNQYCILNKQYTREDWYKMADKIFSSMEHNDTLGNSFPGELNPFYLNDTMAGIIGNFSKDDALAAGYMWREDEIKIDIPKGSETIGVDELSDYQGYDTDGSWKINPEVLKKVIIDKTGNYYRIVQMEYDFLMKHSLPLPEIHWMDRMRLNLGV